MAKLFCLFPHTSDDGKRYDAGDHRIVDDTQVVFYTAPEGSLVRWEVMEMGPTKAAPAPALAAEVEDEVDEEKPKAKKTK